MEVSAMPVNVDPGELPVTLLFNLDPAWTPPEREEALSVCRQLREALATIGHPTTIAYVQDDRLEELLETHDPSSGIVFNWCESIPGVHHSEGLVARILESQGFVFTGSNAAALELSQDKARVKELLVEQGIRTPPWRIYHRPEHGKWGKFPAIVKLENEHASEGITRDAVVTSPDELVERVRYVIDTYEQPALVEEFIDGREFHVSLWGNGKIEVLPAAEMDFSLFGDVHDRLCTYDAKFVAGSVHYEGIKTLLPAPLAADELRLMAEVCCAAYSAVGCRDYGRVDLRLRDGQPYVLDVNPNADITADTSFACAAEVCGYSYGQLCSRIVSLAARRHPVWGYLERTSCSTVSREARRNASLDTVSTSLAL
jgi:D-alanine-D-alanine ligase